MPLREVFVLKHYNISKTQRYKVRIYVRRDMIPASTYNFGLVTGSNANQVVLCWIVHQQFFLRQLDVLTAFLFARSNTPTFLELPAGHPRKQGKTNIWKSHCATYDLKKVPQVLYGSLSQCLLSEGFARYLTQPCFC